MAGFMNFDKKKSLWIKSSLGLQFTYRKVTFIKCLLVLSHSAFYFWQNVIKFSWWACGLPVDLPLMFLLFWCVFFILSVANKIFDIWMISNKSLC